MNCPICNTPIKRKDRATGAYHVYVCRDCMKEFFVLKGDKDYSCVQFTGCAIEKNLHCKDCSHSRLGQ